MKARSSVVERRDNVSEAGGSTPSALTRLPRKWAVRWAEDLPCATGTYLRRWVLETPWWSLRLHHWLHGDDARHQHDHPWGFYTLVLWGCYYDVTRHDATAWEQKMNDGRTSVLRTELMKPGTLRYRPADHAHTVMLASKSCWTIVLTGPQVRRWGFWVGKRWKKANKFFLEHGVHPCR